MITLTDLSYSYKGKFQALYNISARIEPGIHLLLGENGAGKTTLLHVIAGLLIPEKPQECMIDEHIPGLRQPSVLSRVFIVSDNMRFPFHTIQEMVERHSVFYPSFDPEMLRRNLETFGMTGREPIDAFSLGNRKKAILAYAFALQTDVLLLDEPANGLDISAKQATLSMMAECVREDHTVILSTHTVNDFEQLFDSVMVLSAGQLTLNMPVWKIVERIDFVSDSLPPANALYVEQSFGRFRGIVPHVPGTDTTDIDYVLLYNGLHSPTSGNQLITLLSEQES